MKEESELKNSVRLQRGTSPVTEEIVSWLADMGNNCIEPGSDLPAFGEPLVGIASGGDELFTFLKGDIGADFYWTPVDGFLKAYPQEEIRPEELSVVAWILPQTKDTRLAHRKESLLPSIQWSRARHYGEKVNEQLRRHLVALFRDRGYQACAPVLLEEWSRALSPRYGFSSSWSERHAAYVCGLGTFGVSDGLITAAGKAVRVGSVIVRKKYPPTPRSYQGHHDWCLFHATGKCLVCARRCPAGAISKSGHDKERCKAYIRNVTARHVEENQLGFRVNSCGLCQTGVPCEARNPLRRTA